MKQAVRERYGRIAEQNGSCGCAPTCCSPKGAATADERDAAAVSQKLGYSAEETATVPEGSNLGLGCGNPQATAALKPGETVLDLGSGAGFDTFLAARAVGPTGRVIGVDMTPEMVSKGRKNKANGDYENVEFRIGEIESLPVADATVDVIISNCVINLSPDKPRVFREAFRVLKPGGRLVVSDIVTLAAIPETLRKDWEFYTGCVAGALLVDDLKAMLKEAGFTHIRIVRKGESREIISGWFPGAESRRLCGIRQHRGCEARDQLMNATLEHIWHEFADKRGQFIRSRVSDPATAQDILQDVLVKIQKRLGQLQDPAKLQGWIYLIARNAIIDHDRTRKATVEVPESLPAEPAAHDSEVEDLKAAFRRMIYSLPEPYREPVVLTEFDGLTQQELADRLGISLSGAKSRVQRGRAQLKQMLDECCTFDFDRRGKVIGCEPRAKAGCDECGDQASKSSSRRLPAKASR